MGSFGWRERLADSICRVIKEHGYDIEDDVALKGNFRSLERLHDFVEGIESDKRRFENSPPAERCSNSSCRCLDVKPYRSWHLHSVFGKCPLCIDQLKDA